MSSLEAHEKRLKRSYEIDIENAFNQKLICGFRNIKKIGENLRIILK